MFPGFIQGISDTPAWIVSQANQYARMSGKTPFVIYQGAWNVLKRDFERDIIPMAKAGGLALAPWGVLAAGKIRTDEEERRRRETGEKGRCAHFSRCMHTQCDSIGRTLSSFDWERNETERAVSHVLEEVAVEVGAKNIQAGKSSGNMLLCRSD